MLTTAALVIGLMFAALPAQAGVPYSWWCYTKAGQPVLHTTSSYMVGYVTVYRGWRCVGGFYSWV